MSLNSQRHTRSRSNSHSHAPPPPPPQPQQQPQLVSIDPEIWRACAGRSVPIPTVHSRVYYFPQGHLEHSINSGSSPVLLSPRLLSKPLILCRIAAVDLLADPTTDEVFAKVLLHPVHPRLSPHRGAAVTAEEEEAERENDGGDKVVSFAKILTPSDANNGGGFSVPRFCADSIFPPLNYKAEPPVQTLSVTDLHGVVWDFRHIYRGTPRRHLLTTGWSKFVNSKMLVAGDSVVFMRNPGGGEMYVGVRRTVRAGPGGDCGRWSSHIGLKSEEEGSGGDGFKAKLSAKAVVEAAEMAAQDMPFEVVYYPKAGWADFVVKAEKVEKALNVYWTAGMRVKMAMETEDNSRMTWFQGTLSSVFIPESGHWKGSPWRMLQVTWDEPEVLQTAKRVSPWQVDFVASTPSLHPAPPFHTVYPLNKRFRAPLNPSLLRNGEEEFMIPMTGAVNLTMGQYNAPTLNCNIFPAGMQGARQDLFGDSNVSHLFNESTPRMCSYNSFGTNNMVPSLKRVSTELSIGSPQSDQLSPDSQSSPPSFGTEHDGNRNGNSRKVGRSSFQLFGQTIPIDDIEAVGCTGDGGNTGCNETELLNNPLDSYTKLLERIDVRAPAVEACTL